MTGPQLPVEAVTQTEETRPFWEAAREDRLVLPHCVRCERAIWYPRASCPHCGFAEVDWRETPTQGTVYSHTVITRGPGAYAAAGSYVLAYVELAAGPMIMTNVIGCPAGEVAIGDPVQVMFEHGPAGEVVLRARHDAREVAAGRAPGS